MFGPKESVIRGVFVLLGSYKTAFPSQASRGFPETGCQAAKRIFAAWSTGVWENYAGKCYRRGMSSVCFSDLKAINFSG